MAKCIRCDKGRLTRTLFKLKDGNYICSKCFRDLGFRPRDEGAIAHIMYSWDDIKDGHEAMSQRRLAETIDKADREDAAKLGLDLRIYRELEAAEATLPEMRLVSAVCAVLADEGCDLSPVAVASGGNGSLLMMADGVVMLQLKSDSGVKWIMLPHESEEKIRISGPARINAMAPRVLQAYRAACGIE